MTRTGDICAQAGALQQLRRYDDALALLGRGLADAPDDHALLVARSSCLRHLDRDVEALEAADAAIAVQPDVADGHVARAWALLGLAEGAQEAQQSALAAVRLEASIATLQVLATAALSCGDVAGAEHVAGLILAQAPDSPDGLNLRGQAAMVAGDWALAEQCFTAVLGMAPDAVEVMTNLAVVLHTVGRHDEAGTWLRRVGLLDPARRATASRLADVLRDALQVRLRTGRTPEAVVRLLEAEVAEAGDRPPFVTAMLEHLLASRLLVFQGKDSRANVLRGVRMIEELTRVDPEPEVGAPPPPTGSGTGWVAQELHTAAWLGGVRHRRRTRDQWLHDAAEANLVAVPVAGDRAARVEATLRLLEAAPDDEPMLVARGHVTAGRAWGMRPDGDRTRNIEQSAAHYEAALATYTALRVVGRVPTVETYLADALLTLPPGRDRQPLLRGLAMLESAVSSRALQERPQPLAVAWAGLGEGHYALLRWFGDVSSFEPAVDAFERSAALFQQVGQVTGAAHFHQFAARTFLVHPGLADGEAGRQARVSVGRAKALVTRHGAPIRWSSVRADLADAHRRLGTRRDADRAVELAREAFGVPDRESDPKDWALCGRSLMSALAARAEHGGRHAVAQATEARDLLRAVVPVLQDRCTLPERLDLQVDVSQVLRVAALLLGQPALLAEAELALGLARPQVDERGYARLVDLLDAEEGRCAKARAALGIGPVS